MSNKLPCLVAATILLFSIQANAQEKQEKSANNDKPQKKSLFNEKLAKRLGADEYGMKSYVLVTLITGKNKVDDPKESKKLFAGHFANMKRLAKEGKLVLSGPFVDGRPKRGLFIFNVVTLEEAEKLVKSDPAVKAGVFDYEMTKLYASAALMQINQIHSRIQKTKIE